MRDPIDNILKGNQAGLCLGRFYIDHISTVEIILEHITGKRDRIFRKFIDFEQHSIP